VVVTGGSHGLRLAIVEVLVARGVRVTMVARDRARTFRESTSVRPENGDLGKTFTTEVLTFPVMRSNLQPVSPAPDRNL
jgi:NAD(P)-dependent dehydrogenase (short-subunit alcohol dehydrogenase family)